MATSRTTKPAPPADADTVTVEIDEPGMYPADDRGIPTGTTLHPLDAIDFLSEFVEAIAPELFDRARQRFMIARNTERAVSA